MDKQTITKDIKKEIGNWPCLSDIAKYLGKSRDYANNLMQGCEFIFAGVHNSCTVEKTKGNNMK